MQMKKITAFLLAAALAISITACKKTTDNNTSSGGKNTLTLFVNGFLTPPEDQQFVKEEILPGF